MLNSNTKISEFIADDEGATAVEYGLLVALIAAVIVGTVATLGGKIDATGFPSPDLAGKLSATWSRRDKLERRIVK